MQKGRSRRSSPYLTRRRWTDDDARAALADLDASGLDVRAFALDVGLDPQRLKRWRRTLAAAESEPMFEEVVASPVGPPPTTEVAVGVARGWFEVVLVSGRVVRVPESFDAGALDRLLVVVDKGATC
jgi:transposase-like protein